MCLPLFSFQCKKKKDIVKSELTEETQVAELQEKMQIPEIRIVRTMPTETDRFHVKGLAIKGDILSIDVEYSGGSKEHTFELFSNQMLMKSLPPKMTLFLQHQANGDLAKALITKTLLFDLKLLSAPPGTTILTLNNADEPVELIRPKRK